MDRRTNELAVKTRDPKEKTKRLAGKEGRQRPLGSKRSRKMRGSATRRKQQSRPSNLEFRRTHGTLRKIYRAGGRRKREARGARGGKRKTQDNNAGLWSKKWGDVDQRAAGDGKSNTSERKGFGSIRNEQKKEGNKREGNGFAKESPGTGELKKKGENNAWLLDDACDGVGRQTTPQKRLIGGTKGTEELEGISGSREW